MYFRKCLLTVLAAGFACTGAHADDATSEPIESAAATFRVEHVAGNLSIPWAMAFLADGRAVVSERAAGRLTLLELATGELTSLDNGPADIFVRANAGMLDVRAHPQFTDNGWIYYAYTAGTEALNTTVVERARLDGSRLINRERIFEALPWFHGDIVYGCRLAFRDGYLYVTMGERWDLRHLAQSVGSHLGKVMRLHEDGSVPDDNPFVDVPGAAAAVWSYGHRNPQGLTVHPQTGELWLHEHGPRGGDEVNLVHRGRNYGWPIVSYGKEYSGEPVDPGRKGHTGMEDMEGPVHYWDPSIAPSGMMFYDGDAFPGWRGDMFIGALAGAYISRLVMKGATVIGEERLLEDALRRVRFLEQGPEGYIYFGVDGGEILRLVPAHTPR
ncbi:MAG: PQQ-dependent sugar dehydrogenase [Gammaproteobacteria bacterium]|nr:PQQ-dependent sugar dehydrogenase [Gammaproteobacteria bacterium]MDH5215053.1 PQQ-dependent sugar dehydrogenase [Gammaproteobacteria bacterium]